MVDFTIKSGSYCPVCEGAALRDCGHTMSELRAAVSGDASLAARLAEAERDAARWQRVRRLSYEISDPDLRGTVCSFLDRFADAPR